jgi:hypothetical protein
MTEQEKQASLAEVQETLYNTVFVPAFVKLAADKGVNITTEAELAEAVRLAMTLEASQTTKQAQDNSGFLKQAADALQSHVYGKSAQSEEAHFAKQAAALPEVRQALSKLQQLK